LRRVGLALVVIASCASPAPPPPAPIAAPPPAASRPWRYDVTVSQSGDELAIEATIFAPNGGDFSLERGGDFATVPLATTRDASGSIVYRLPPCPPDGCRVRYGFRLAEAARRVGEIGVADSIPGAYLTSPSAWLLHPSDCEAGQAFELRVHTPPGTTFVSGLAPLASNALPPAAYGADVSDLANPAWAALGTLHLLRVNVGAQTIDVAVPPGPLAADV
jgi:hypothetical protein